MRRIKSVFLSILVFTNLSMISCAPQSRSRANPDLFADATPNVSLVFPEGTNAAERELLLEAVRIQVNEFEIDWGTAVFPPVAVFLTRDATIPCKPNEGEFIGCHYSPFGPIHAIMGDRYHVPVIYHELVHHMIENNDSDHSDPRWASMWEPRQTAIANGIWADRSILNFDEIRSK